VTKDPWDDAGKLLAALDFSAEAAAREREHQERFVDFVRSLLDVIDSFDRVLEANAPQEANVALNTVRLIARQLEAALARGGVTPIACLNTPLDPQHHEVVEIVETTDAPDDSIIAVQARGFEWNGLAIRRPRVVVAHHPKEKP
jgi:molecular chaperone GrpE